MQLVDAVSGAFSQICVHLSEPLYDMVLSLVFNYATQNVRSNAVRAIHQLVECVANAHPEKTLARFLPFCFDGTGEGALGGGSASGGGAGAATKCRVCEGWAAKTSADVRGGP